jgi:hypothetical protein
MNSFSQSTTSTTNKKTNKQAHMFLLIYLSLKSQQSFFFVYARNKTNKQPIDNQTRNKNVYLSFSPSLSLSLSRLCSSLLSFQVKTTTTAKKEES